MEHAFLKKSLYLFILIFFIEPIFSPFIKKQECKQFPAIIMITMSRSTIKTIAGDSLNQKQENIKKNFEKNNLHIKSFTYNHIDSSVLFSIATANYQFLDGSPPSGRKEIKINFSCSRFTLYRMSMAKYDFKENDMNEFTAGGNPIEFKIIPAPENDAYNFYFTYNIAPEEQIISKTKEIKKEEPKKKEPAKKAVPVGKNVVYSYETNLPPVIDGKDSDNAWKAIPFININLSGPTDIQNIQVKSVYTRKEIFFIFKWRDATSDYMHRLWMWDKKEKTYLENDSREDRLVIKFSINNVWANVNKHFSICPEEGISSAADIWDWRAALTNPSGCADDKKEIMSLERLPRSYEIEIKDGRSLFLQYIPDDGTSPYKQDIPTAFAGEIIPQFITQKPSGSRADVIASGSWSQNHWVVEFERRIVTSDKEDVQFNLKGVSFLAAVYDHSELEDHSYSRKIDLEFK
ncbi:MAG: ethylbenzene dehydrogenase-related protein [bacterium]